MTGPHRPAPDRPTPAKPRNTQREVGLVGHRPQQILRQRRIPVLLREQSQLPSQPGVKCLLEPPRKP